MLLLCYIIRSAGRARIHTWQTLSFFGHRVIFLRTGNSFGEVGEKTYRPDAFQWGELKSWTLVFCDGRTVVETLCAHARVCQYVICRFMGDSSSCVDNKLGSEARGPHHAVVGRAPAVLSALQGYSVDVLDVVHP